MGTRWIGRIGGGTGKFRKGGITSEFTTTAKKKIHPRNEPQDKRTGEKRQIPSNNQLTGIRQTSRKKSHDEGGESKRGGEKGLQLRGGKYSVRQQLKKIAPKSGCGLLR